METYLTYANRDWASAHNLYKNQPSEGALIVYAAQQAAEKYAKEVLFQLSPKNNFMDSHSIWKIIQEIEPGVRNDRLHSASANLTNLFYDTRYPGPDHQSTVKLDDITQAIVDMDAIREYCLGKLQSMELPQQITQIPLALNEEEKDVYSLHALERNVPATVPAIPASIPAAMP